MAIPHIVPFVVFIIGFTSVKSAHVPVFKIITGQESKHVLAGKEKELTLGCHVEGEGYDPFEYPIAWKKVVEGKEYPINLNRVINEPYKTTGRYSIVKMKSDHSVGINLQIKDIQLEDNGTYLCKLSKEEGLIDKVQHEIIVYSDIEDISFTSSNQTSLDEKNGMTFTLNDGDTVPLTCISKGGNPKPRMNIYKEKNDISSQFNQKDDITYSGNKELQKFVHTVTMEMPEFKVSQEDDGKILKCEAIIHNVPEVKSSTYFRMTSAKIQVRYGPRFQCDKEMKAAKDKENYEMECTVTANPPLEPDNLDWHLPDEQITMKHGESAKNYSAQMTKMDDGTVKAVLTIKNVTDNSYQTYHLNAKNDVAEAVHKIRLVQESESTDGSDSDNSSGGGGYKTGESKDGGGAACITVSLSSLLLALLIKLV